jgi:hypothetical protein
MRPVRARPNNPTARWRMVILYNTAGRIEMSTMQDEPTGEALLARESQLERERATLRVERTAAGSPTTSRRQR